MSQPNLGPTPETDASIRHVTCLSDRAGLCRSNYDGGEVAYVPPDFARRLERERDEARERVAFLEHALAKQNQEIEQTCGKALGYPWFKDDQKNFPGATEADGVCVGEHVAETIVAELANAYQKQVNTKSL